MAGGLARITTHQLVKKYPQLKIIGIDSRRKNFLGKNPNIKFIQMKYSRSNFENLFREYEFSCVIHLGRMGHVSANPLGSLAKRLDLNVMGTQRILELCDTYGVKKALILSTFHVYGAYSDNQVFLNESSPLRADFKHPELRDVVEMDQLAANWMWKNRDSTNIIILRPTNIIGSSINNAIKQYLTSKWSPTPIDFNPKFQFVHEFDMANCIVEALTHIERGIFNVAPDDFISLRDAKQKVNRPGIPFPIFLIRPITGFLKKTIWNFPDYLIDYIKYSCLIENKALKSALPKFKFKYSSSEAVDLLVENY